MARSAARALNIPVVTIGNFVAGGAGKTPAALAIAQHADRAGRSAGLCLARLWRIACAARAACASKSRARTKSATNRCCSRASRRHSSAPIVSPPQRWRRERDAERARARRRACRAGASSRISAIAIVDGETGVGNGLCLPAGPLARAARRRNCGMCRRSSSSAPARRAKRSRRSRAKRRRSRSFARGIEPDESARALAGRKVVAFAGIGRPEKFFATLEEIGAKIVARESFARPSSLQRQRSSTPCAAGGDARRAARHDGEGFRAPAAATCRRRRRRFAVRMIFETAFEPFLLRYRAARRATRAPSSREAGTRLQRCNGDAQRCDRPSSAPSRFSLASGLE